MPIETTRRAYDVVIAGGAATGSSASFFLAGNPDFDGSILVVERDRTYARSATALSFSSIRHQFSNAINVQISQFGTAFIREFEAHVGVNGTAPDLAFKENGYLFLTGDAAGQDVLRRNHATQLSCGADIALLGPDDLAQRFPWLNRDGISLASHGVSGEGWFDSNGLMQGFQNRARALGAEYVEAEMVALRLSGNRVTGVILNDGATIACGAFINAAGTRGPAIARLAGIEIPVEPRRRSLFVFSCRTHLAGKVPLTIDPSGVFFRPEGQVYLAGTSPKHDPAVDVDDFDVMYDEFEDAIWPALAHRVPAFDAIKMVKSWAGHYDYCTLDHNAIVGAHPNIRNFFFANGFSGHGLQQSPAIGRALSELITYGEFRTLDLSPIGFERVIANRPFLEESII